MQKTCKERLLALADYLEHKVPSEQFDYREWVGKDWKGKKDLSCGTTACALGWATTMPMFKKLGLCLVETKSYEGQYAIGLQRPGKALLQPVSSDVADSTFRKVLKLVFGTTDVDELFVPSFREEDSYGPVDVTWKIRRWVASRELKDKQKAAAKRARAKAAKEKTNATNS